MGIFQDIKTAVTLTGEVRKARKAGANAIQVKPVRTMSVFTLPPAFINTMEGPLTRKLGRDVDQAVFGIFNGLPHDIQRWLEFVPEEPGEWVGRVRFWQGQLRPALPPKMYHAVMLAFIRWYIHCLKMRKEGLAT